MSTESGQNKVKYLTGNWVIDACGEQWLAFVTHSNIFSTLT